MTNRRWQVVRIDEPANTTTLISDHPTYSAAARKAWLRDLLAVMTRMASPRGSTTRRYDVRRTPLPDPAPLSPSWADAPRADAE